MGWMKRIEAKIDEALVRLAALDTKETKMNKTMQDIKADTDALNAVVKTLLDQYASTKQQIADLSAQVAAGTPVDQAALDAIAAELEATTASVTAALPQPAPAPPAA